MGADNDQGEIYLTDVIAGLGQRGERVTASKVSDPTLVLGVNSPVELAEAEALMGRRIEREKQTRSLIGDTLRDGDPAQGGPGYG